MYDLTEIDSGTEELKAAFSHALELMFPSEPIDARRAETLGLVNRDVPDTRLPEAVFTLANSLVQRDQRSNACKNDNLDYAATSRFLEALDCEAENMIRTAQTRTTRRVVRAFR